MMYLYATLSFSGRVGTNPSPSTNYTLRRDSTRSITRKELWELLLPPRRSRSSIRTPLTYRMHSSLAECISSIRTPFFYGYTGTFLAMVCCYRESTSARFPPTRPWYRGTAWNTRARFHSFLVLPLHRIPHNGSVRKSNSRVLLQKVMVVVVVIVAHCMYVKPLRC
jgi:hypothetical protein